MSVVETSLLEGAKLHRHNGHHRSYSKFIHAGVNPFCRYNFLTCQTTNKNSSAEEERCFNAAKPEYASYSILSVNHHSLGESYNLKAVFRLLNNTNKESLLVIIKSSLLMFYLF